MGTYARKPVELVRGRGMQVEDSEGRTYLDFVSGVGAVSLGHCHPALVSAIEEQASTLVHVSNYYYIEHRGEVAHLVSDLLNECVDEAEREPWQSFFANSGAEANECAFKLARLHAKKRAMAAAEAAGADEDGVRAAAAAAPRLIVTLDASFHGRTLATLAATAQPAKQEAFQPLPDGFVRTPINDIKALESLFASQGDGICAVMVECVQGESGVHPCESEFLAAVRRLTAERGALFMCDEIQCGMSRCACALRAPRWRRRSIQATTAPPSGAAAWPSRRPRPPCGRWRPRTPPATPSARARTCARSWRRCRKWKRCAAWGSWWPATSPRA